MAFADGQFDVVMLGTFAVWRLGTLQARALPFARELARRGLRVALLTMPWDAPAEAGVRDVVGGVTIVNTRGAALAATPWLAREACAWVRAARPALLHVFKPKGFGGLVGQRLLGDYPVLVDSDDWEGDGGWNAQAGYSLPQRRLFDWQERSLLARADAVTAASALLERRAMLARHGRDQRAVWRLPNGLDDDWITALAAGRAGRDAGDAATVVLYSRYAEFGSDWLPRFVAALSARASAPVTLRLVGDAPHLEGSARVRVERLGYVARHKLPVVLGAATLALHPLDDSLVARAKQSVKLLELMAAGCPVVASAVGDVAATLGDAGVTLDDGSPERCAAEVARVLVNPPALAAMRAAGPPRVRARFRVAGLAETLLEAYAACGLTLPAGASCA